MTRTRRNSPPPATVDLKFKKDFIPFILSGLKTVTIRTKGTADALGLAPGEIATFTVVTKEKGQEAVVHELYVRCRGPRSFAEALVEFGGIEGLTEANVARPLSVEEYYDQLPDYGQAWVRETYNLKTGTPYSSSVKRTKDLWLFDIGHTHQFNNSPTLNTKSKELALIPGIIPASAVIQQITVGYGLTPDNLNYRRLGATSQGTNIPEWDAAFESWPIPEKARKRVPKPPVPFAKGTVAIVDMSKAPGRDSRGLYMLDPQGRYALVVGEFKRQVHAMGHNDAFLQDKTVPQSAMKDVLRLVFQAQPYFDRGWQFEPVRAPDILAQRPVSLTDRYRNQLAKVYEKHEEKSEAAYAKGKEWQPKASPELDAYFAVLTFGLSRMFPGKKDKTETYRHSGLRRGETGAVTPVDTRAYRAAAGDISALLSETEETTPFAPPGSLYRLARQILAETSDEEVRDSARTAIPISGKSKREHLIDPSLIALMEQQGIQASEPPASSDKAAQYAYWSDMRNKLEELEQNLQISYHHEVPRGETYDMLRASAESPEVFEEVVARFNPDGRSTRRERKPRKERLSREARSNPLFAPIQRNPLPETQLAPILEWASAVKLGPIPEGVTDWLKPFQTGTPTQPKVTEWPLTNVTEIFPTKGQKQDFSLKGRRGALGQFDLVSQLEDEAVAPEIESSLQARPEFYRDPTLVPAVRRQAELSFTRTKKILETQMEALKGGETLPASTAMCKDIRVQRLSAYRMPPALVSTGGPKKAVIWISPEGAPFRIMSIRRNTHIDCDLIPIKGLTPIALMGRALQAALYWLAEDPRRHSVEKGAVLYVGRIGRPTLAVAWEPGQPLTLGQVQDNLGRSLDGTLSAAKTITLEGYTADARQADIQNYVNAVSKLKARRYGGQETAPPPPPRAPQPPPPFRDEWREPAEERPVEEEVRQWEDPMDADDITGGVDF